MKKMVSICVLGIMALATISALAQQPKFDIADVHVGKTPRWFAQNNGGQIRDGRYVNRDATLLQLIEAAYSVKEDDVSGGPNWLDTDIYDVIAKAPEGTTPATARLMLQPLLAERFALVTRKDTRPVPRYVLSVGKGGSKLKPAAKSEDSGCKQVGFEPGQRVAIGPGQAPPNLKFSCHNLTSQQIAENIRQMAGLQINSYLSHDVYDSTGLEGKWDFDLEFTQIFQLDLKGRDSITLFDALNKQLGLSLELKDVPMPALVVESADRKPTPSAPNVAKELGVSEPRFEVASIKPVDPNVRLAGNRVGGSELRFIATLKILIGQAFFIQPNALGDEIIGLPKSADSQLWEINAKLPSTGEGAPLGGGARPQPPPRTVVMEMVRNLLADQFELKTHTENREATVYVMTVSGKPKMVQAAGTERMSCKVDPTAVKPFPNMGSMVRCTNITMDEFAENLEQATGFFDHPIVNGTGLKGGWTFIIGWSRPNQGPPPPNANQAGEATEPVGLTSYEAVERQLGVKLVKQKRSIPVIVVDHVDEKPID